MSGKLTKAERARLASQMRDHEEQAAFHAREAQRIGRILRAASRSALKEASDNE